MLENYFAFTDIRIPKRTLSFAKPVGEFVELAKESGVAVRGPIERTGNYTRMPVWLAEECRRPRCEVCSRRYGMIDLHFIRVNQCLDHIFPVRFLLPLHLNAHLPINIVSLCASCHGVKLPYETRLFGGDVLSFIRGLQVMGYPLNRVNLAAAHYGFRLWTP